MGGPVSSPKIPTELQAEYADWSWEVAYQAVPEVLTYRLSNDSGEVCFLKVAQADWFPGLDAEAHRVRWAGDYLPVPAVIQHTSDGHVSWLLTGGLPGRNGTDPAWAADAQGLVAATLRSLRPIADLLPYEDEIRSVEGPG